MKIKWIFLLSFFTIVQVNAQFQMGYVTGGGSTDIREKSIQGFDDTYSYAYGFTIGTYCLFPVIKEHLYFRTDFRVSQKGALRTFRFGLEGELRSKFREEVYYAENPILLQFKFFPYLKLQGGITNSLRLNMRKNKDGYYDSSYIYYDRLYDIGYIFGLLAEFKQFFIEININKSITPIAGFWKYDNSGNKYRSNDVTYFNKTMFVTIGYKLYESRVTTSER